MSLSPLAAAMAAAVDGHRTRRVPFRVLVEAAAAIDLSGAGTADWRSRLAAAVDELGAAGVVELPARAWDDRSAPPLPEWVQRPAPAPAPAAAPAAVVWDARLAEAATLDAAGSLSDGERRLLVAVNDWLRDHPQPIVIPVRERSWQLLGDEKALERLRRGRLFATGVLDDALLAIEPTFAPIDTTEHGADPDAAWLIVENYTTYQTLSWLAGRTGWQGRLLWGAGNQAVARLEAAVDALGANARALWYFGDVDAVGLRLARDVTTAGATLGLPECRSARPLYRMVLAGGAPVPGSGRVSASLEQWLQGWLGPALACQATRSATQGRLPQEAVRRDVVDGHQLADLLTGP